MKTLRMIVGVSALAYAVWCLLHGAWLCAVQHGALGWSLLLDPRRRETAKLRARLMFVVLLCVLLRLMF
jgi:hypothetical protein